MTSDRPTPPDPFASTPPELIAPSTDTGSDPSSDTRFADVGSADTRSADTRSADTRSADTRSADVGSADMRSADAGSTDTDSQGRSPEITPTSITQPAPVLPAPATAHGRSLLSPATFRSHLARLKPLLIAEWPQLRDVDWSQQDLDAIITKITTQTRHTRTLIHHQISELSTLLDAPARSAVPTGSSPKTTQAAGETSDRAELKSELKSEVDQWLDGLEVRAEAIAQQLRQEVWPEVRDRAQRRVGPVLLLTLLAGVAIGWSLRGSRRGQS